MEYQTKLSVLSALVQVAKTKNLTSAKKIQGGTMAPLFSLETLVFNSFGHNIGL